jgi:hypothetical protein
MEVKTPHPNAFYHHGPAKVSQIHPKGMSAIGSAVTETATQQYRNDHRSGVGGREKLIL